MLFRSQFEQPVNFTNVRESKLLTGDTRKVEQGYFSMALIAGYTYYF